MRNALLQRTTALLVCLFLAGGAHAGLDLRDATVRTLDNGLMVLVLEEPAFPVVSVQMLYRVGARNEVPGLTGLAHFVEHMAFRGSEHFPDTGLVSSIYAVGGEWHGYTYVDQTTYFSTARASELDLLLRIEADRMSGLDIAPDDLPAERGAVLAEMHGYENDAAAVLHDATTFVSLLAHPYRNNTIGWESDIRAIGHADVVSFYRRHYHPGNAVLAIVGDVSTPAVMQRIAELFAGQDGGPPTALPVTPEPTQAGVRRIRLEGDVDRKRFQIAWHAPAAVDPDYPAFLLLQELLSGSGGINFLHNDWGTPARGGSPLHGISNDIASWMMPTAQPYIFVVKGSIPGDGDERAVEHAVTEAVAALSGKRVKRGDLRRARERLLDQLALDVQTTEDAAHQLAFFSGIDALEILLSLPVRLSAVTAADIRRVASWYLAPEKRTIGWSVNGETRKREAASQHPIAVSAPAATSVSEGPLPPAELLTLSNGLPVVLQPSTVSPLVHLKVVMPGDMTTAGGELEPHEPVRGVSSFDATAPAAKLAEVMADAALAVTKATPQPLSRRPSRDPATRVEELFSELMGPSARMPEAAPLLIVLAGDFSRDRALRLLEEAFADMEPATASVHATETPEVGERQAHIDVPLAQARIAYLVPAPAPQTQAADAWQVLQYILSHDYEGRLGKEAISRRGLVYYIDSRYRSDGHNAWVTLSAGVDPAKLAAMRSLLEQELERLQREPPSAGEVNEALTHRLGRAISAAQSNRELSDELARQWLWYGKLLSPADLAKRLDRISRDDVLDALDDFTSGAIVTVTVD